MNYNEKQNYLKAFISFQTKVFQILLINLKIKLMSKIELPKIIADYIKLSSQKEAVDTATYFTNDAAVKDEGKTYKGQEELKNWLKKAAGYNFNVEILDNEKKEHSYFVFARLTDDFPPPNPVKITYHFTLKDGKTADLFIK